MLRLGTTQTNYMGFFIHYQAYNMFIHLIDQYFIFPFMKLDIECELRTTQIEGD